MKLLGFEIKAAKKMPKIFTRTFYQQLGRVNNYDNNHRIYIEEGYQDNPIVKGIVRDITKNFGKARWFVKNKRTGEEIKVPILSELMVNANPDQSLRDFHEATLTQKLLLGNSFDVYENGTGINAGIPSFLWTIPAENVTIVPNKALNGISGYQIDSAWADENVIPASQVLHLREPNPDWDENGDFLFGDSPFRSARRSIQAYNDSLETGVWFLQNKGAQKMLVNEGDAELSPEAMDQLKKKLRSQSQGPQNAGNMPIVDGKLRAIDVGADPTKALVLEQRMQAACEICNVMGYPKSRIGLQDSTYQNAKEAKKAFWENCVIPELEERAAGYNRWLAPLFGKNILICYDINHIDALQEDRIMRGEAVQKFAGMVTINEAREMAGLPPIDKIGEFDGDEMYVGFTQAVVRDNEEISSANGQSDQNT